MRMYTELLAGICWEAAEQVLLVLCQRYGSHTDTNCGSAQEQRSDRVADDTPFHLVA